MQDKDQASHDGFSQYLKKGLSSGVFPRHPTTVGPDNKKTMTKHAKYSIRGHPACISLEGNQFKNCMNRYKITA